MAHPEPGPELQPLHGGLVRTAFDTRAAFAAHLREGLERAQREVWIADRDFADWPLAEPRFTSSLQRFLRESAANRLRLMTIDPIAFLSSRHDSSRSSRRTRRPRSVGSCRRMRSRGSARRARC